MGNIIAWTLWGFIVGLLARAVLPGRQKIGIGLTILLGVVGSILGGVIASLIGIADFDQFDISSLIGSVIVSVILLAVVGRMRARSA
jgi:uncharacterized membrane protein YeaQ/YmgE (transglycosylase-associated protein family)